MSTPLLWKSFESHFKHFPFGNYCPIYISPTSKCSLIVNSHKYIYIWIIANFIVFVTAIVLPICLFLVGRLTYPSDKYELVIIVLSAFGTVSSLTIIANIVIFYNAETAVMGFNLLVQLEKAVPLGEWIVTDQTA